MTELIQIDEAFMQKLDKQSLRIFCHEWYKWGIYNNYWKHAWSDRQKEIVELATVYRAINLLTGDLS